VDGVLIRLAEQADFMHLMGIALKKANENIVLAAPVASREYRYEQHFQWIPIAES
jgi:hypothetical protein